MSTEFLNNVYFGNKLLDYLIFLGMFCGSLIMLISFEQLVLSRLKKWAASTTTKLDDFIVGIFHKNIMPLLYFGAMYISTHKLLLPELIKKFIDVAGVVIITVMAIRFLVALSSYVLYVLWIKPEKNEAREHSLKGFLSVIKILIWGSALFFFWIISDLRYQR